MHLYNITIQKPTAINQAITGSFSAPKATEIIVARGKSIELLRQDDTFRLQSILYTEAFGVIRCIMPFRLTGSHKDYIVVGSDSGRLVILEYDAKKNVFNKVHQETFGKTGCRRIVPGQYLAIDPKGRSIMIGAIEKQKFVYVLNRDSSNRLTISSPLEAHKSHTVAYSMVGLDVGYEHPNFAVIEVDHSDLDNTSDPDWRSLMKKMLTYYELDLGLNHVVRKWASEIPKSSHHLISVPDKPGGVIVCYENFLLYKHQGHPDVTAPIPLRFRNDGNYKRGLMIVTSTTIKTKNAFFFLIQSEYGDLYKVTLDYNKDKGEVHKINIRYFDTVPVAVSICVLLRTGFLFVASEFGNHKLYKFEGIGDDTENVIVGSTKIDNQTIPLFNPRKLKNLALFEELESLSPIIDFKPMDLMNEGTPQLYTLCGRGPNSSLRILRHGLAVSELANSPLRGQPTAVWTVKQNIKDKHDKYIVVSFANQTMVLSVGKTVQNVSDSGFLGSAATLNTSIIGENSLVQIHSGGIRHIRTINGEKRINEWDSHKKAIVKSAVNESQVVIALSGGEIIYFELNTSGQLTEVDKKDLGQDVACMAIGTVPQGRLRSRFLAVGFYDKTVRVFSLDPEDCLQILSRQAVVAEPESLNIVEMTVTTNQQTRSVFNLYVGLNNGILLRSVLDSVTGELSDTRTRFLGSRPVKLMPVKIQGQNAILALSSRSWLCYNYQGKFHMTPLSYDALDWAAGFSSEQCPEGIVAITPTQLRVFALEKLGEVFNQQIIPLSYTPRRFIVHPQTKKLIIIQTDHNAYTITEKNEMKKMVQSDESEMDIEEDVSKKDEKKEEKKEDKDVKMEDEKTDDKSKKVEQADLPEREFGTFKREPNSGKWASYVTIYDPIKKVVTENIELQDNEAAFSVCTCTFQKKDNNLYLIVGGAKDLTLFPRRLKNGFISVYKFIDNGNKVELVHKTEVEEAVYALHPYQGRLLAGVGNILRLYDIGKKKLLRKCETKLIPTMIVSIHAQGNRIYVGDVAESFHYVKYKKNENTFHIFADSTTPRWLTAGCILDYNTMAGADKFGNVFVLRLPPNTTTEETEEDHTSGNRWIWERGLLNGAPHKAQEIIQFYVGETITGLEKTSLIPGGQGILMYATIMGSIGVLIPFASKEDIDFFTLLEMHMRQEHLSICGRDHLAFRSSYFPCKNVIDGDLLEMFPRLDLEKQRGIAEELERTPNEVMKKLEDMRNQSGL